MKKSRSKRSHSSRKVSKSFHSSSSSFYIPDMTYMEIQSQIQKGRDTLVIPIGGYEQNGPYVSLDKHQVILQLTLQHVAIQLPILIAPVLTITPGIVPSRQVYPGTLEIRPETFVNLVSDVLTCYQQQGFKKLIIVTDHAGTQPFMINAITQAVEQFNTLFSYTSKSIFYSKFYDVYDILSWIETDLDIKEKKEGIHDDIYQEALLSLVDTEFIRYNQRKLQNKLSINGIDISSLKKLKQLGNIVLQKRLDHIIPELKHIIEN